MGTSESKTRRMAKAVRATSKTSNDSSLITPPPTKRRPLGVVFAIFSMVIFYGIGPLLLPFMLIIADLRRQLDGVDVNVTPLNSLININVGMGIIVFVIAFLAWRGKPARSRWWLIIIAWIATVAQLIAYYRPLLESNELTGSNLTTIGNNYAICLTALQIFVPLYITWYMNRAPARDFYRKSE